MSGSVASIGDRADFRNTSAGIATRFMLLLYERIPVCKASVVLTLTSSCSSVSGLIAVSQNCGPL